MDNMPIAMILADRGGIIRAVGNKIEDDFGYRPDELVGRNLHILMSSPHRERHDGYISRYLETGERRIIGAPRIENALHKNGHAIAVEINIGETELGGERMFIGFLRPIEAVRSNRQQIQTMLAELAHISRVSAMGALATAIAHELNQPLTTIANFAAGARDRLAAREDSEELEEVIAALDNCGNQAVRAGQLLHRLREFVEPGDHESDAVPVEELVDATISLALINGYRRSMVIDRNIPHGLPPVRIDAIQAEQVLYNLLRNAFDAMSDGPDKQHRIELSACKVGESAVAIAVEDSGPGVPADLRDKIFQSFVTTKSGGMGVGLSICRQIVESFGGTLELDGRSKLGGARFVMTLPCGFPDVDAGEG
ncbi:PAS domain S-box protein [Aurantiacibacter sp. MUD11]|nr:ATP-binding protein [Aurantiacibacter sp. MUD11]WAT16718.1 PAS domain S-box protein [Aurantiacibacter sp. MUD11]